VVTMDNKSQCQILYGFPGVPVYHSDYHAFLILNYILGQAGMGGKIGARLREEKGLAGSVSSFLDASLAAGPFAIQLGVSPQNVDRAVALIQDEIARIKQDAIDPEELARAKRFLINSMPLELESNEGITRQIIRVELHQLGDDYLSRFADLIETVTMDKMMDCWRTQLEFDKAALVIAGPYPLKDN
jgi:zinc protease